MTARAVFRLAAVLLVACAVVRTLALVGTPAVQRALMVAGRAALSSDAVGLLLLGAVFFFSLSCASRAWSTATRQPLSPKERAESLAASYLVETYRPRPVDRAPCGEPIRFSSSTHDRGNAA